MNKIDKLLTIVSIISRIILYTFLIILVLKGNYKIPIIYLLVDSFFDSLNKMIKDNKNYKSINDIKLRGIK